MLRLLAAVLAVQLIKSTTSYGYEIQPRIINGEPTNSTDYRFFTQILTRQTQCGGTLISNKWVLTAAHCMNGLKKKYIFLGIYTGEKYHKRIKVYRKSQYRHPEYDSFTIKNDIALIELPDAIDEKFIKPAKLPKTDHSRDGDENVVAFGMGMEQVDGPAEYFVNKTLKHAEFVTLNSLECVNEKWFIDPISTLCARSNNRAIYRGDSGELMVSIATGGPLMRKSDNALVGIISFSDLSALNRGAIQGFTYVPHFYPWIKNITGIDFST